MHNPESLNADAWSKLSNVEQNVCTLGFGLLDRSKDFVEQIVQMTGKPPDFVKTVLAKNGYNTYEAVGSLLNMTPKEAFDIEVAALRKLTPGVI